MNQRTKRRLMYGIVSFAMLYGLCMVIGNSRGSQTNIWLFTLQYLGWSFLASLIIGAVTYVLNDDTKK